MKKRVVLWLVVSAIIMLVLPWLAVTFVKGDAGMAVCFLLFYAINPIYSVIIGAVAGKDIKHLCNLICSYRSGCFLRIFYRRAEECFRFRFASSFSLTEICSISMSR